MGSFKFKAKIVLLCVSVISILFLFSARNIEFDYDFEAFFADNDPATRFLKEHRKRFETDNDFVFVSVETPHSVFNQDFLSRTQKLVEELSKDSLVNSIQCLTNMTDFVKTPLSPQVFKRPYIDIDSPQTYHLDSAKIFNRPELAGFMIRSDAKALLILIKHQQYLSKKKCDLLKATIYEELENHGFKNYTCAGRAIGIGFYIDAMQFETLFFIGLSFLLIIVFLIFMYRSAWGVLIPLTVVATSMLWIVGFMALVGQPINLVLTTLPSIIFVVAMSDVVHLISKYFDELRLGKSQLAALKVAYKEIGFATLLTSFTTAVGFLTLLTVSMRPVHEFGIYTAIGVLFAFLLAYTLLPGLLILTKPPKISTVSFTGNTWYPVLHRSFKWVIRYHKQLLIGFIGIIGVSLIGLFKVEGNYYLLEDLKESSQLRQDYKYFDEEFMGLRPFELSVHLKDTSNSILDYEVLTELNKIDSFLSTTYDLKRTASIVQLLKVANRTEHGGQAQYYKFPSENDAKKFIRQFQRFDKSGMLYLFVDSTYSYARFSSSSGDDGLYAIQEKNEKLHAFFETSINLNLIDYQLTGTGHLLDRNMSTLSMSLTKGLLLAVLIVSFLMGLLYRSLKMVLIAIVPNLLPLLMLAALLGYFGIQLKVSTAIIFTIAFGIAVDDTIHFMSKLKLELRKEKSFLYALKRTYLSSGRAIILTTLILCSGFLLLMFSDFLGTFYVGLLISCTLMFALLADLIFLPVLLILFYYLPAKSKLSSNKKKGNEP